MSVRIVVAVLLILGVASSAAVGNPFLAPKWHQLSAGYTFDEYARHFNKDYDKVVRPQEYARRKTIFERRLATILAHNTDVASSSSYKMGVNKFTDWTVEERQRLTPSFPLTSASSSSTYQQKYSEYRMTGKGASGKKNLQFGHVQRRGSVDWRSVTPPVLTGVKDQGYCGSCWAFGTTATLESHYALTYNKLVELSPQQLISCAPMWNVSIGPGQGYYTLGGCDGNMPQRAMEYLVGSGGLTQEFMYPYESYFAQNGSSSGTWPSCSTWRLRYAMTPITGFVTVDTNDQEAVMTALANDGPLTVVMYVLDSFMDYEAGIYQNSSCVSDEMQPSHIVQLIGYGHDAVLGQDYWIVRNSWSPMWGDNGYFRLLKTDAPMCGQMSWIENAQNVNVTSCGMCGVITNNLFPIIADQP